MQDHQANVKKDDRVCPQCGRFPDLFLLIVRKDKVMRYLGAARPQRQTLSASDILQTRCSVNNVAGLTGCINAGWSHG